MPPSARLAGTAECDIAQPLSADLPAATALDTVRVVRQRRAHDRPEVDVAVLLGGGLRLLVRHWLVVTVSTEQRSLLCSPAPPEASAAGRLALGVLAPHVDE